MGVAKKLIDKKVLRDLIPINALSAVHLEEISRKAVIADVRAGRYVFKKGDRDYQSVYLLEGKVELTGDKGEVVGQVQAGSDAARHPLAHHQPRQLSARAVGQVTVACVDSSLLDVLLTWDESAGYDVVEIDAQEDDDWMTRVLQSQAFLQLPPSNIHQLLMRLEMIGARAGDVIVRQGDDGDYFYIVKSGRLAVTRKASPRGKEVVLAELGEGACFGEEALVSDAKRNASVTMLTEGALMRLAKQDFRELLCTPLVHEIEFEKARELASQGAQWLDVRLPGEFENQAIKGSRNLPLSALREASAQLDSDATYIVCCDTGRRSAAGAFVLSQRGFNVYTLKKGLMAAPADMLSQVSGTGSAGEDSREAEIIPFEAESRGSVAQDDNPASEGKSDASRLESLQQQLAEADAQRDEEKAISERMMLQVESLEQEVQQLKEERDSLEARLQGDTQAAQADDREREALVARLEKEQQERDKQLRQLEQELTQVREDYRQLGQRASALGGERDAVVRDLQTLKQQLSSREGEASDEVRALEQALEQRNSELEEEKNQHARLAQQFEEQGAAHQKLEQTLEALNQQADTQRSETATLSSDLEASRKQAGELETRLAAAEEKERELRDTVEGLEVGSREALEQLRTETEQEQQALSQRNTDLQSQLEEQASRLEAEQTRAQELEQQLAEAGQEREQARQEAQAQLQEAQRAAEESLEQLRAEASSAREDFDQQLAGLQERLADMERQLEEERSHHSEAQEKLAQSQQQHSDDENRIRELETSLQTLAREHESDIKSVRDALTRAQDERENVKRDQKRLMDSLRKAENGLAQARQDHEEEVYRLRKELKESAGEDASGLAAELEALQQQLKAQAQQREELEITLGSRSEQLESAQLQVERLEQQLVQAQDSARQAEQQLVEANEGADQEMTVRLQAEQEIQQALREELEKAVLDRDAHQERLTVLSQEIEELRGALQTRESEAAAIADLQQEFEQLGERLQQVEQERDRLQEETDQLRAEAEVTRGLVDMAPSGDGDAAVREELIAVKKNVEVAVRLRSQAEARAGELEQEVARLQGELESVAARQSEGASRARIPSLDEDDPHAAGTMHDEYEDLDEDEEPATAPVNARAVSPEANSASRNTALATDPPAVTERGPAGGGAKYLLVGLLIGSFAAAAGMWWLNQQSLEVSAPSQAQQPPAAPASADASPETVASVPSSDGAAAERPEPGDSSETGAATEAAARPAAEQTPVIRQPAGYFTDRLRSGQAGPAMVEFHADRYLMGSGPASPNFDERPRHEVQLKRFAVSRYETTFEEYDRFARDTGRTLPRDMGWGRGKRPVVNVSWGDATAYAQWLSGQTGYRYRLPSEAEWEFVARAGSTTRFWWGNKAGSTHANCFDCGSSRAGRSTVAVGSFEPSNYGVFDMAGNVREWVRDCHAANYSQAPGDGGAVESPGCAERVVRGGGFGSPSNKLRSTARDAASPKSRLNDLGFRVVRDF